MRTLAVCNQKGGAGKTTVAMLLADALHRQDFDVLVVDTDPQGSAWKWETRATRNLPRFPVRVERATGMSKEAFARWLKDKAQSARNPDALVDYLVIDTPPRLDSQELYTALYVCDIALVPFRPHVAYVDALEEFVRLVERVNSARVRHGRPEVDCRGVLNCFSGRRSSERELIERASQLVPWPMLGQGLKDLAAFADAFNFRTSLYAVPGNRGARTQLETLLQELDP